MVPIDEYRKSFKYESAFYSWWYELAPQLAKIVGHDQTWWMAVQLRDHWKDSPTAERILQDRWEDERRREEERKVPVIDQVEALHTQIVNLVSGYND